MPKETQVRGVTYPSIQSAADALGVTRQAINMAAHQGRLNTVGLNPRGRSRGKRVELDGVAYKSMYQAAKQTGVPYDKIKEVFR
jgi:hypothetical protein